jgi:hypothetical protein
VTGLEAAQRWVSHGSFARQQTVNFQGLTIRVLSGPFFSTTPAGSPCVTVLLEIRRQSNNELLTPPLDPHFVWVIPPMPDGLTTAQERQFLLDEVSKQIKAHADSRGVVI